MLFGSLFTSSVRPSRWCREAEVRQCLEQRHRVLVEQIRTVTPTEGRMLLLLQQHNDVAGRLIRLHEKEIARQQASARKRDGTTQASAEEESSGRMDKDKKREKEREDRNVEELLSGIHSSRPFLGGGTRVPANLPKSSF